MITAARARYIAELKNGELETYDPSWPCLSIARQGTPTKAIFDAHKEVVKIFKRLGVK